MLVTLLMVSSCLHETDEDSLVVNTVLKTKHYKISGLAGILSKGRQFRC